MLHNLLAITLLTSCITAFAQEQEETTTEKSAVEQSADIYADGYNKFRFGGYGEILANFKDYGINRFRGTDNGSKKDHRNSISIPRYVLAFDFKFNSFTIKLILFLYSCCNKNCLINEQNK